MVTEGSNSLWKTPQEWCEEYQVKVIDPDGWRGPEGKHWEALITVREFALRFSRSTISSVPGQTRIEELFQMVRTS